MTLRPSERIADGAAVAVIAALLAVVASTFRDYGITWDEPAHVAYGDHILEWTLTLGADRSALAYKLDYLYGGGFDTYAAIARRLSPLGTYDTVHLFGALVGVLGCVGTWRLARHLGGAWTGLAALVLLVLTPVYYGHMFNNPKDLPFAVGYVWALYFLVRLIDALPRPPRSLWILVAVSIGFAMSVRIAGLLTLCYLLAIIGVYAWRRGIPVRRYALPIGAVVAGSWALMLSTWPWAQLDPLRRPIYALGAMSRYLAHRRRMPFAGEEVWTTDPRWDYLLHYFGLKLPIVVLGLFGIGLTIGLVTVLRRRSALTRRWSAWALVGVAILTPPLYAIVARSTLYDGLRHFLFLVPPICVVAGAALAGLPRHLGRSYPVLAYGLVVGSLVLFVRQVYIMGDLHPHQYVFFNRIAGGLPGAYGRYDTDYYGNAYKEAFRALAEHLWHEDGEAYLNRTYRVSGCIPDPIARHYLPPNFVLRKRGALRGIPADFYIGYTRANCHNKFKAAPVLLKVERQGTLLTVVRDMRPLLPPTAPTGKD